VRVPSDQRQPIEIAADIVEVLRADDSAAGRLAVTLQSMAPALRELRHVKQLSAFKWDIGKERHRLDALREKYAWLGPLSLSLFDRAISALSGLEQMAGPRTQADPYIKPCVVMAADMIRRHSRDKRFDYERLGKVSGYVYEAVTGIRGKTFRRACQEFIAEAKKAGKRTSRAKK
jgi:hypothetical protein